MDGSSSVSRYLINTLHANTAACSLVSPMPTGSDWKTSGLSNCITSGKVTSVKRMAVRANAVAGDAVVPRLSRPRQGERRRRCREESDWLRICRQGFREWVVKRRKRGVQYVVHAVICWLESGKKRRAVC